MKTQTLGMQAFNLTSARLSQLISQGGGGAGLLAQSGELRSDILELHSRVSKDLSVRLGLHPEGFNVPYIFIPTRDPNDVAFGAVMNWSLFRPEYFVHYNAKALQSFFEGGQSMYPVGTDAQFTVPIGATLLYRVAHEVTHALHWISILSTLPTDFQYQDSADKYLVQYNHFFYDAESKPFVEGVAELGALIYLRNIDHPVARKFAALHVTTRMLEAAHFTGRSPGEVGEEVADTLRYFTDDDESITVHNLTIRCFKQHPEWIVAPLGSENGWRKPYSTGLMQVGQLVFSRGMKVADLMRMDLAAPIYL